MSLQKQYKEGSYTTHINHTALSRIFLALSLAVQKSQNFILLWGPGNGVRNISSLAVVFSVVQHTYSTFPHLFSIVTWSSKVTEFYIATNAVGAWEYFIPFPTKATNALL